MQEQNALDASECLNCPPRNSLLCGLPADPVLIAVPFNQRAAKNARLKRRSVKAESLEN
jgi:hypothetical protein